MTAATEPRIRRIDLGITAVYLLQAERALLLVDSGYATNEERLFLGLRRIGVNLGDIGLLLLTHHHDDHAGLCSRLTTLRPEIRVIVHERAVALLAHGANDLSHGGFWLNSRVRLLGGLKSLVDRGWSAHRFPPYRVRDCDVVIKVERDDEVLRRFGIAGSVVALPGHTVDSIGIVLDSGDAFVGDAAANFLRFAGTRHCVVFVTDLDEYYASWRRLIDAGARRIHPAHGASFPVEHLVRDLGANRKADLVRYPIGVRNALPSPRKKTKKRRTRRLDWAALHQHTFGVDVLRCPCRGRRRIHAIHSTRKAAEERLVQLGHHLAPSAILPPATAQPVLPLAG